MKKGFDMKNVLLTALVFSLWSIATISQAADATYSTDKKMVLQPQARPTVVFPANVWVGVPTGLKVVAPEGMTNVTEYLVRVEKKAANAQWVASPAEPFTIPAARAQSENGFPAFAVSSAGAWRVSVMAFRPAQSGWSIPVGFTASNVPATPPARTPSSAGGMLKK